MNEVTYSCVKCRIHLHQDAASAMCERDGDRFLCISCYRPMD